MAVYCYRCRNCGVRWEGDFAGQHCTSPDVARDYQAEGVGVAVVGLKREREAGGRSTVRDKFLPTLSDFKGPTDPDGTKGMRTWADEHDPKPGNKTPLYPEGIPKRSW